ncbi:MAG: histidine phosphatase family protein [Rhodobacteraceae bacterium]|nr:histidine phosphatase family protein [Paracoccaceae bacterium]
MSHVTLVRHGQANSAALDELDYDRLSPLGWQQARWLGEHLRDTGEVFARLYCGTLRRHRETAQGLNAPSASEIIFDDRLNELEYFTMSQLLAQQHDVPTPNGPEEFARHFPKMLGYWQEDRIINAPERFSDFEARVEAVLTEIAAGQGRALVVTSGGLIGMAMRVTMGLDLVAMSKATLAIQNSSLHRWQPMPLGLGLTQFNATPHLESADRAHARTHV